MMRITPEMFRSFLSVLPLATVNILVTRGLEVLLVKRLNEPAKGYWYTPGGIIRKGETIEESALRVCREETGLTVRILDLLGVYDEHWPRGYFTEDVQIVTMCYWAEPIEGTLRTDWQSSEVKWFPSDRLPEKTGETAKKMMKAIGL